jgi:F0F1-type ATP synthase assembly protein I
VTDRRDNEQIDESKGSQGKGKGEAQEQSSHRSEGNPGAVYQGAFEAVAAILIAGFAGKLADDYFGTEPRYLLIGFAIGFSSFVLRLVRLGRKLAGSAENDDTDGK